MFKAKKNFSWCIKFKKVDFEENEVFDASKVADKAILDEMVSKGYAEEIKENDNSGDGNPEDPDEILNKMSVAELKQFASETFGVKVDGKKDEIIAKIKALSEEAQKALIDNAQ